MKIRRTCTTITRLVNLLYQYKSQDQNENQINVHVNIHIHIARPSIYVLSKAEAKELNHSEHSD